MVKVQDKKNAQYNRIEDTMMEFCKATRDQGDTLGMSQFMREHLSLTITRRGSGRVNSGYKVTLKC
ncbi:hypothetical protein OB13_10545 [Pontibacter sp. HJ8]